MAALALPVEAEEASLHARGRRQGLGREAGWCRGAGQEATGQPGGEGPEHALIAVATRKDRKQGPFRLCRASRQNCPPGRTGSAKRPPSARRALFLPLHTRCSWVNQRAPLPASSHGVSARIPGHGGRLAAPAGSRRPVGGAHTRPCRHANGGARRRWPPAWAGCLPAPGLARGPPANPEQREERAGGGERSAAEAAGRPAGRACICAAPASARLADQPRLARLTTLPPCLRAVRRGVWARGASCACTAATSGECAAEQAGGAAAAEEVPHVLRMLFLHLCGILLMYTAEWRHGAAAAQRGSAVQRSICCWPSKSGLQSDFKHRKTPAAVFAGGRTRTTRRAIWAMSGRSPLPARRTPRALCWRRCESQIQ